MIKDRLGDLKNTSPPYEMNLLSYRRDLLQNNESVFMYRYKRKSYAGHQLSLHSVVVTSEIMIFNILEHLKI